MHLIPWNNEKNKSRISRDLNYAGGSTFTPTELLQTSHSKPPN